MPHPPADEPIIRAIVAPLCVCNDEPMLGEKIAPGKWRFICACCGAVVYVVDGAEASPPPASPTDEPAGSPGKIAVMYERFRRGESLFSPRDNREPNKPPGAPGVVYDDRRGRWQVRVSVPGVGMVFVGTFDLEATAQRAAELARDGKLREAVNLAGGDGRSARRRA